MLGSPFASSGAGPGSAFPEPAAAGSMRAAREAGTLRTEGKDYVVQDGDVLLFKHRG